MQTSFAESEDDPVRRPLIVARPHVGGGDQPDPLLDGLAHQWRAVPDGSKDRSGKWNALVLVPTPRLAGSASRPTPPLTAAGCLVPVSSQVPLVAPALRL